MKNAHSLIGRMMLVGAVIFGGGCGDGNSKSNQQPATAKQEAAPVSALSVDSWAEVLEQEPDPKVVTDADLLKRIMETKFPWRVRDKKSDMEMLLVPPGKFVMGISPGDEEDDDDFEKPAHEVTITKAFYLGKTEVTQEQWVKVMQSNPSMFQESRGQNRDAAIQRYLDGGLTKQEAQAKVGPDLPNILPTARNPVENVSWDDCQKFCAATGLRLPTEAEWEYACRAGTTTPQYGAVNDIAWYWQNWPVSGTQAVAGKLPNAFGLYDMLGNVLEWVYDGYGGYQYAQTTEIVSHSGEMSGTSYRVKRGSSWNVSSNFCRASARGSGHHIKIDGYTGFRSARTP